MTGSPLSKAACALWRSKAGLAYKPIKMLLDRTADPSLPDVSVLALSCACQNSANDIVDFLLRSIADPDQLDHAGSFPVIPAVFRGFRHIVQVMLPLMQRSLEHVSAETGKCPHSSVLKACPVSLVFAASQEGRVEILRLLLDARASPSTREPDGFSALHVACQSGCNECVQVLVAQRADISAVMEDGQTALHVRARRNNVAALRILLACGADRDARTELGRTAEAVARNASSAECCWEF